MRRPGSRGEPEKTRAAILKSALQEFSQEGIAGARTDEIARRAGVNKALLYYYFRDKEDLYTAALEEVFSGLHACVLPVFDEEGLAPARKLLKYVETHFDYIASHPVYPRLVQREYMRTVGRTLGPAAGRVFERYGRAIYTKLDKLIRDGIAHGDFRELDPGQTIASMLGVINYYFISLPAQQVATPGDPASPERIAARRVAVLDFVSAAVFCPSRREK